MFDAMLAGNRRNQPIKTAYSKATGTFILKFVSTNQNCARELSTINVNPEIIARRISDFISVNVEHWRGFSR